MVNWQIRLKVYELLKECDFKAQMRVARKDVNQFEKQFNGDRDKFYDDLVQRLFKNALHKSAKNIICFAERGVQHR